MVKEHDYRVLEIIYAAVIVVVISFCFFSDNITTAVNLSDRSVYKDLSGGWKDSRGIEIKLDELVFNDDGICEIYHMVPGGVSRGQTLHFNSHNVYFSVYIGHHEVYSFYPKSNITGYGYGDHFHEVELYGHSTSKDIRIKARAIYKGEQSGSFGEMAVCSGDTYMYSIVSKYGISALLSLLIVFFGITLIALHFSSYMQHSTSANMYSLGVTAILMGLWTLQETMVPNLLFGGSGVFRAMDYLLLLLINYPFVVFVRSITKPQRKIYEGISFAVSIITLGVMFFLRFSFNADFHQIAWIMHLSIIIGIVEIIVMLIDNHMYCARMELATEVRFFYVGSAVMMAGGLLDMLVYTFGGKNKIDHGFFLRWGLVIFIVIMLVQVARWMSNEQKNMNQEKFINGLLKYSMVGPSPETNISNMIEYMGKELHADRTFIMEEREDGTFETTYEWCRENVKPLKDRMKAIPFRGTLANWFTRFNAKELVKIYDFRSYLEETGDPAFSDSFMDTSIDTLMAGQLSIDETHIGCFGLENITKDGMDSVADVMDLTGFFISVSLRQRDTQKLLRKYSYRDQMTGVMNRRALDEFELELSSRSKPYGVLMADINGLKRMNDVQGHDAGDQLIRDVANALSEVFGRENVYRLGGDEFLAIGFSSTEASFLQNKKTVQLLLSAKKRSASMGCVFCKDCGRDFEDVKKEADSLMYKDKQRFYEMDDNNRRFSRG